VGRGQLQRGLSNQVPEFVILWRGGEKAALESLMLLPYGELRRIANHYRQSEPPDQTPHSTALVHEVYVRLIPQDLSQWQNRAHFFALTAQLMPPIPAGYARSDRASKRGGSVYKLALDGS
jgi:hypothetical protein